MTQPEWHAWSRQRWGGVAFDSLPQLGEECECDGACKLPKFEFGGSALEDALEQFAATARRRPAEGSSGFVAQFVNFAGKVPSSAPPLSGFFDGARYADIYVSVGFDQGDRDAGLGGDYLSCTPDQSGNCGLYRIRFDFWLQRVEWVTSLDGGGGVGFVQPAVSPDGTQVAVVAKWMPAGETDSLLSLITIMVSDGKPPPDAFEYYYHADVRTELPHFPTWRNDSTLLFDMGYDTEGTLVALYPNMPGHPTWEIAGPAGATKNDTNYKDPEWSEAAEKLVTFGVSEDGDTTPPQISNEVGGNIEPLELGRQSEGRPLKECHHPSWNPAGDRVLCTNTGDPEGAGPYVRPLYEFGEGDGVWENLGPLFEPPTDDELQDETKEAFDPDEYGRDEMMYTYKYAQWCGREDYVVAGLLYSPRFPEDETTDFKIQQSRIVLLRYEEGAKQVIGMWDLTAAIEEFERDRGNDAPRGSMRGYVATCSTASVDAG